jgi:addiction module RelE/StbE family toxin
MVKLIWSEKAISDLELIAEFIASDSMKYAKFTVQKLNKLTKILKQSPKAGRIVPEINDQQIRELISGNYRIIYHLEDSDIIEILTIHHAARSFPKSL